MLNFPEEAEYVDFIALPIRKRSHNAKADDALYIAKLIDANLELLTLDIAYFEEEAQHKKLHKEEENRKIEAKVDELFDQLEMESPRRRSSRRIYLASHVVCTKRIML